MTDLAREIELLDEWAFVEIMGHRHAAGQVTTVRLGGAPMLQVDTPEGDTWRRQFYGTGSVYCLRPATEEQVRAYVARFAQEPHALVAAVGDEEDGLDDFEDEPL